MEVIKQIVKVPASRELSIKLPENAVADREAEVTVLFESARQSQAEKLAAMQLAMQDEIFVSDLGEAMADFEFADREAELA